MTHALANGLPLAAASWELFRQLLVSGVLVGSTYALIGVSFGVIYSTTRIFHLAHSVVYVVCAYIAVVCVQHLDLPLGGAIPLALISAGLLGLVIELVFYRQMRAVGATLLGLFLVSLALQTATPNLIQIIYGPGNQPLPGFPIRTIAIGRTTFTTLELTAAGVSWLLIVLVLLFMTRTKYGRAITAVRTNRAMAAAVGISPDRIYLIVFALGSMLVGVASLFFTMGGVAFPQMGLEPILIGFIAVFLGGIGSTAGAALGGLVLGLASSLTGLFLSTDFSPAVVFGILFLVLIVRPQGLLGRKTA
jgi:branched-chain amino acid transport system permease protein